MIKFKTITIKNFLSIGNVTQAINLNNHGLSLVVGHNEDSNGGITKNGAGKSSILQAISFALYGSPLTKIKIDNLINNINQKNMLVTLEFSVNDEEYRIERGRKPNFLKFYVNGTEIEDRSKGENRETQDDINRLVGMSHMMFTHIVALNTYTQPFLRLSAKDQRDVSEELLGVTQISSRAEVLKRLMLGTKDSLKQEEANVNAIKEANSRIEQAIDKTENQKSLWDITHSQHVAELSNQIEELAKIDFEAEKSKFDIIDNWKSHLITMQNDINISTMKLAEIDGNVSSLKEKQKNVSNKDNITNKIVRLNQEKSRIATNVSHRTNDVVDITKKITQKTIEYNTPSKHKCSTCAQDLMGTTHLDTIMQNIQNSIVSMENEKNSLVENIGNMEQEIQEIEEEIKILENNAAIQKVEEEALIEKTNADIELLQTEKASLLSSIENIKDKMMSEEHNPVLLFESRDELYSVKHLLDNCIQELDRERNKENPFIQQIDTLKMTLRSIEYDEIDRLNQLFLHQDFLSKLLTNKDSFVRKKIIDQNLYYLNTRLNYYLEKLGLPHEVVFQNDLTTDISLLGRDFDFEQLSRGEMNRVIMSVSWAFRDVWESLNSTINLIWLDEMLDTGLDSNGAEAALAILKSFGRNGKNVFLISHRDELMGRIDQTLFVSKDNGFTTIDAQ